MNSTEGTEFVFVRHGQTEANGARMLQGQLDSPLDDLGKKQVRALAQRLRKESFDRILSSDLGRAVETADAIREFHPDVPFSITKDLREWHLGEMEGKTFPELNAQYGSIMASFYRETEDILVPGGESRKQLDKRIADLLDRLAAEHSGERLLLVTHGGALQSVFRKVIGRVTSGNLLCLSGNASISVFRKRAAGWQMITWNDCSHLRDVGQNELFTY